MLIGFKRLMSCAQFLSRLKLLMSWVIYLKKGKASLRNWEKLKQKKSYFMAIYIMKMSSQEKVESLFVLTQKGYLVILLTNLGRLSKTHGITLKFLMTLTSFMRGLSISQKSWDFPMIGSWAMLLFIYASALLGPLKMVLVMNISLLSLSKSGHKVPGWVW